MRKIYVKLRFQKTTGASASGSDGHGDGISDRTAWRTGGDNIWQLEILYRIPGEARGAGRYLAHLSGDGECSGSNRHCHDTVLPVGGD